MRVGPPDHPQHPAVLDDTNASDAWMPEHGRLLDCWYDDAGVASKSEPHDSTTSVAWIRDPSQAAFRATSRGSIRPAVEHDGRDRRFRHSIGTPVPNGAAYH